SFLGVFRSLPSLEKSVGKCLILLKPRASRLVLQLHCKHGEYQRGQLWLAEYEFQSVAVAPGSHITFCLKEFRGLLSFAEASNLPLTIHFDEPGRPVIFTLDDTVLEVHLVLATLSDLESSSQSPSTNGVSHLPAPSDDFADDLESYMAAMETSEGCSEGPPSPTFPLRTPQPAKSKPQQQEEEEEEEEEEE
ncbi:cell cycle checkpoint control protein RAD9A, partial [Geospiza fortis]|uniref:Cell cycle checkpoint control protein RAD9A n=1 Tax=Geospiza fortis TaxID=48883 RepID=A0A6I9Z7Q1_GEOFO